MGKYVGAIDQGTTSTRFIVFDAQGAIVAVAQKEHQQIYPQPGWVEHSPVEIARNTEEVIAAALQTAKLTASDLVAVGITNQRETTVVWDRSGRADSQRARLAGHARRSAGRVLFGAGRQGSLSRQHRTAARQLLQRPETASGCSTTSPGVRERARAGELMFGTIDSWVVWNLTGGRTAACTSPT